MRVNVLGDLQVEEAGVSVPVRGTKQRALLTLLAINVGHVVSVDRLVDELWGDGQLGDVGNALQHHVSRLRKAIGPSRIAHRGTGYALEVAAEDVDAVRFERLTLEGRAQLRVGRVEDAARLFDAAEALWRGAPLAEFDEDWARPIAARLDQLRLDSLEDRIEAGLRLGRHRDLVGELEELVKAHPYRERLWGHLMVALYRCGRQADALAAFREARDVLTEEKGLAPGPELSALEVAVLRHDPELAWNPTGPSGPAPAVAEAERRPVAGNLPAPLTAFIGRDAQLDEIARAVTASRLVTLTGTGGSGKTRLAIEVARSLGDTFPDGVWMVELAALTDSAAVPHAIATALSAGDAGRLARLADGGPPFQMMLGDLAARRLLLVLDNCEHVLNGVAQWTSSAVAGCPDLHVLATSREPLGVVGETQWFVPPLGVPGAAVDDPVELTASESVRLFVDRANRVAAFEPTPGTIVQVATLCRHLDGLPLAIELAAARTKAVPVSLMVEALPDRFAMLVSANRTAPPRQRTLRAAIDWSYETLDDDERTLFEVVSLFDGGCSLDAVTALAATSGVDPDRTLDLLVGLVDKSLVLPRLSGADGARYDLLETLREYGREQLARRPRVEALRRAHRAFFVDLVERAELGLRSSDHLMWHRRLDQDFGNVRTAYEHAITATDWEDALRIAGALWWFWPSSQRQHEGRERLTAALEAGGDEISSAVRAKALTVLGYLAGQLEDLETAATAGAEAIRLCAATGDDWGVAWARGMLALILQMDGDDERSAALLADARAVMDAADDHWYVAGYDLITTVRGLMTNQLDLVDAASREVLHRSALAGYEPFRCWGYLVRAVLAERRGDTTTALVESERALASARRVEVDHYLAFALTQFGRMALGDDAVEAAEESCREAVAVAEAAGADWFAALARVGLAAALRGRGEQAAAGRQLDEVRAWSDRVGGRYSREFFFLAVGGDPVAMTAQRA